MKDIALVVVPIIAVVVTLVFKHRKTNAEAESLELDNVEKMARIWRNLSGEMEQRFSREIDALRNENEALQNKINQVMQENRTLKKQMVGLERENKILLEQLTIFNKNNANREGA